MGRLASGSPSSVLSRAGPHPIHQAGAPAEEKGVGSFGFFFLLLKPKLLKLRKFLARPSGASNKLFITGCKRYQLQGPGLRLNLTRGSSGHRHAHQHPPCPGPKGSSTSARGLLPPTAGKPVQDREQNPGDTPGTLTSATPLLGLPTGPEPSTRPSSSRTPP